MYAAYSKWIQKEIDSARRLRRPIVAVNPHGQQRRSSVVGAAAASQVGWRRESVVNAIYEAYIQGA